MSTKIKSYQQFIDEANNKFNYYFDYSKSEYINSSVKIIIICPKHGTFYQSPYNHLKSSYGCVKCMREKKSFKKSLDLTNYHFWNFHVIEKLNIKRPKDGSIYLCRCECGKEFTSNKYRILHGIQRDCGNHKNTSRDIVKEYEYINRYGYLNIIDIKNIFSLVHCDCGKERYLETDKILDGTYIDCGCKKFSKIRNTLFQGVGEISLGYYNRIKNNAISRNYIFDISIEYICDLFIKQDRKCALSGLELIQFRSKSKKYTASLDRVDSSLGYIKNNVQWVHKDINKMKSDLSDNDFITLCNIVSHYNTERT